MKHAHHVLRAVPGLASIKAHVACPALHLASGSHVICVALRFYPAAINVLVSVGKHVLKATVISVAAKMTLE